MKNLIRKILKENQEDDFEWARGFDTSEAEKVIKKPFSDAEGDYDFDGLYIYDLLVDAGIKDIDKLREIGEELYVEVEKVYDSGRDSGYDSGRDDCTCDGCCDDYYDWDYVQEQRDEAQQEGYADGYDTAKTEMADEIQELKDRIEELESQLNESINKKNIKRI